MAAARCGQQEWRWRPAPAWQSALRGRPAAGADRLWGAPLPISALRRRQDAALTAFGRGVEAALAGNRRAPSAACRWPRRNAVNLSLGEPAPS